jgi:MinD superfamily P-loop ATPase
MMPIRELVVISGKGGTGKTSVVAAFAALAGGAVLADCDVDAADLHLVLRPELGDEHEFSSRRQAVIDPAACTACGRCAEVCRFAAVLGTLDLSYSIDSIACEGCELCRRVCPADAIHMEPVINGAWMVSETRFGPLVHARLGVAEDNSGKLVTLVRNEARSVAAEQGLPLVMVDGSPGIGCPVIASLAGADLALAVTEPTVSGRHDLDRELQVVRQFPLPFAVCINKADLNPELGERIAAEASAAGAAFVATVDYDPAVTYAQVVGTDVSAYGGRAAAEITKLWEAVSASLSPSPEGKVRGAGTVGKATESEAATTAAAEDG